jgi:outer membrane protein OmpA-like peptidoglycan-associated protein
LKQGVTPVSGRVTSSDATATFTPAYDFEKNKPYTATITTGAKDPAGNALATNYEWGFSTGLPVVPVDTTAPTVVLTSPLKGATVAPVNQKATVAFSEAMDPATLTAATFTLKQGTTPLPGKVTSSASTATFVPASDFEDGKVYTATITTGTKDLAGNALANNYVWDFTAHAEPIIEPCVLNKLEGSHFLFNSAEITENGKTILDLNTQVLKDNPEKKVIIQGYTSASGTEEYNQKLSERRANAVKEYLVTVGGIDSNRLSTVGYGETRPAVYESDPTDKYSAAAMANMRVLFEVVEEK